MITRRSWAGLVHGVAELEPTGRGLRPHRLPAEVRRRFPDPQLLAMESQPSGVRIAALTAATRIELSTHSTRIAYRGADRPRGRIDVVVDGGLLVSDELTGGDSTEVDLRTGAVEQHAGDAHLTVVDLPPAGEKVVEIWLPHNEPVELVALRADAPVVPAATGRSGVAASRQLHQPGLQRRDPHRHLAGRRRSRGGVELHNLGFGGSALVDPFMARVMRDIPADLISVKLGINVVNADAMRLRTFVPAVHGFLDTIRDGHPDTPLLLVSPIFCGIHEDTPGPGAVDPPPSAPAVSSSPPAPAEVAAGRLTLQVIREALADWSTPRRRPEPALPRRIEALRRGGRRALPLRTRCTRAPPRTRRMGERFARIALTDAGVLAG